MIIGGEKVFPAEIEDVLLAMDGVEEVIVSKISKFRIISPNNKILEVNFKRPDVVCERDEPLDFPRRVKFLFSCVKTNPPISISYSRIGSSFVSC